MDTHDLVHAKDMKKVKTHREVEAVLRRYHWKPKTRAPVNGWMDYRYEPPNNVMDEIEPLACLPAPNLNTNADSDIDTAGPPPSPDDWKLAFFTASLVCVHEFAARVNTVTGDEIFLVQEKPFHVW